MRTTLRDSNDYIRVIACEMEVGDSTEFDINGEDLGNGFTDTSCHAAWYVRGKFVTSYNGGEPMVRRREVGCAHPTEPDLPWIYPTGKARVECHEEGLILFVQQHDPQDKWEYGIGLNTSADFVITKEGKIAGPNAIGLWVKIRG